MYIIIFLMYVYKLYVYIYIYMCVYYYIYTHIYIYVYINSLVFSCSINSQISGFTMAAAALTWVGGWSVNHTGIVRGIVPVLFRLPSGELT